MRPILSVSLVTFNGAQYIRECLKSVQEQTLTNFEVIIVDNASSDDTVTIAREVMPAAGIIENSLNVGFAEGHNSAIARATGRYVLVLNQDSILEGDYCEKLVAFLEAHSDAASATGTILRCDALTKQVKKRIMDSQGMFITKAYFVRLTNEGQPSSGNENEPREVFGIPATVALYRRSALDDVAIPTEKGKEVFDEDFFMYKEDVDLSYRLQWRGWKSYLIPDAISYHVRTKRGGSRPSRWINELSYRNTILYQWKNISRDLFARVWPSILFFEAAKIAYSLVCEPSSLLRIVDVWRLRSRMSQKRAWIMGNRKVTAKQLLRFY